MERKIFVVSDATGATAEHVLQAALAQFEAENVEIERRPQTRTTIGERTLLRSWSSTMTGLVWRTLGGRISFWSEFPAHRKRPFPSIWPSEAISSPMCPS